jgi:hypothetical protein
MAMASEEPSSSIVFLSSSWNRYGVSLDAEDADELAANDERHAELTVRILQARKPHLLLWPPPRFFSTLLRGIGVEHAADQAGDADRLLRFGDDADDAFAELHFGANAALRVAAAGDGHERIRLLSGNENHRVAEAEVLLDP